tara:strand:- start:730 stop:1590 length:861 start_codon:yes stop_codon:yes gene_type:complete
MFKKVLTKSITKTDVQKGKENNRSMKLTLSAATLALLLMLSAATGAVLISINQSESATSGKFTIGTPVSYGINEYTLVEIDEGDNDEEEVIVERPHEFEFLANNGGDVVTWDFGDGSTGTGFTINHSYVEPGFYTVIATSSTAEEIELASLMITVERKATVESDNMECVCAPTAKSTIVDLIPLVGITSFEGIVTVVHDGSSESCSLRNPLQECHVRVIMERTLDGSIIGQEVLYDDTFRTNEHNVPFELDNVELEIGEGLQLRLETDQARDWHKPSTSWSMTAPV